MNTLLAPKRILDPDSTRMPSGIKQKTLYGGIQVTPTPMVSFGGDILIPASTSQSIDIIGNMGSRCSGFVLSAIVGTVKISINGGGLRTIPSAIAVNDAQISSLVIVTDVASTATLQLHGV
jgi:hypothetical protein